MPANATEVQYRLATASAAPAIAKLHAESWRVAYRGMFPDDFLDNEAFEDRDRTWRERFTDPDREAKTLTVLAESGHELVGFAHSIVDEDETYGTLLDNLHVRRSEHRGGIGTIMMAENADRLAKSGSTSPLYLWVLEGNDTARRFYAALGGEECGRGTAADGPSNPNLPAVPSLRICWPDLSVLSHLLPARQ